jgi:hypothetical protein
MIKDLLKLADSLDSAGFHKEADDLTKLMSVNWNKLNEIEKKKYEELSEKDK